MVSTMKNNDFIKILKETVIPLAGIFLAILNGIIFIKLSPVTQSVAVLANTVQVNERRIEGLQERLEKRLTRVEDKLDNALEYIYSR